MSTYNGVYVKGGPINIDIGRTNNISTIAQLYDRTAVDVRGRKIN